MARTDLSLSLSSFLPLHSLFLHISPMNWELAHSLQTLAFGAIDEEVSLFFFFFDTSMLSLKMCCSSQIVLEDTTIDAIQAKMESEQQGVEGPAAGEEGLAAQS